MYNSDDVTPKNNSRGLSDTVFFGQKMTCLERTSGFVYKPQPSGKVDLHNGAGKKIGTYPSMEEAYAAADKIFREQNDVISKLLWGKNEGRDFYYRVNHILG